MATYILDTDDVKIAALCAAQLGFGKPVLFNPAAASTLQQAYSAGAAGQQVIQYDATRLGITIDIDQPVAFPVNPSYKLAFAVGDSTKANRSGGGAGPGQQYDLACDANGELLTYDPAFALVPGLGSDSEFVFRSGNGDIFFRGGTTKLTDIFNEGSDFWWTGPKGSPVVNAFGGTLRLRGGPHGVGAAQSDGGVDLDTSSVDTNGNACRLGNGDICLGAQFARTIQIGRLDVTGAPPTSIAMNAGTGGTQISGLGVASGGGFLMKVTRILPSVKDVLVLNDGGLGMTSYKADADGNIALNVSTDVAWVQGMIAQFQTKVGAVVQPRLQVWGSPSSGLGCVSIFGNMGNAAQQGTLRIISVAADGAYAGAGLTLDPAAIAGTVCHLGTGDNANGLSGKMALYNNAYQGLYVDLSNGSIKSLAVALATGGVPDIGSFAVPWANLFISGKLRNCAAGNETLTVGAIGAAAALPGLPLGYLSIVNNAGTTVKIPFYNS